MAATVLEERLQRRIRRERRDGEAAGVQRGMERGLQRGMADTRDLLASLAARRFGPGAAARAIGLLAGIGDAEGLRRAGEWIIDCATAEELVERLRNGQNAESRLAMRARPRPHFGEYPNLRDGGCPTPRRVEVPPQVERSPQEPGRRRRYRALPCTTRSTGGCSRSSA